MTDNRNPEAAWTYHDDTKHSYTSIRSNPHFMDWSNQPLPFKIYPTLDPMRLPAEMRQTGVAALSAIAESVSALTNATPDLEAVAQLLYFSAGITRKRSYPGREFYFRAAACTGALYEVELYLVCGDLSNLSAGVYHFAPAEFGLRQLRVGAAELDRSFLDVRGHPVECGTEGADLVRPRIDYPDLVVARIDSGHSALKRLDSRGQAACDPPPEQRH